MSVTVPQRREVAKFRFEVPGRCPSKANHRYDPHDSSKWTRISKYQHEVGIEALRAGAGPLRRKYGKNSVRVEVVLIGQRLDLDNARKVLHDSLQGVAFENDRQVISDRGDSLPDDGRHARVSITVVYFEEEG